MNEGNRKKNRLIFVKSSTFDFELKNMPLKFFEFQEQFVIGAFLIKLTQFEKTRSIGKLFVSLFLIEFQFQN